MFIKINTFICALALLLSPLFAQAAAISPSVIELSALRGEVTDSTFRILNTGASEQLYFLDTIAFEASGDDGTPVFTPEKTSQTPFLSWIDFPSREVLVPAQSKVDVPFTIAVPDDVPSGSYHGAITVSTAPSDVVATNGATIEAQTAILVFLVVEGETIEKLELLDFAVSQRGSTLPFGTFQYRLQNQGNVFLAPEGEITLKGLFGQTIAVLNANEAEGRVLPSSTRTYSIEYGLEEDGWFQAAGFQLRHLVVGPVTAELNLRSGESVSLSSQTTLVVVPVEFLALLTAVLFLVGILYKILSRH